MAAHDHPCKHCGKTFICGEDAAECFASVITCQECFWTVEFKHFMVVFCLAAVAVGMTLYVVNYWK